MHLGVVNSIGLLLAGVCALASFHTPERGVRRTVDRFCRERRVRLTADQIEYLRAMTIRDHRVYCLVGALAFGAGSLLHAASSDVLAGLPSTLMLSIPMVCVGMVGLVHAGREFPAPKGTVGIARARSVQLRDYLAPSAVGLALFGAGLVAIYIMTVGVLRLPAHPSRHDLVHASPVLAHGVFLLALVVVTPAWLRNVCRRPERAVDEAHLYLLDAWRAEALREAVTTVCLATFLGTLGGRLADSGVGIVVVLLVAGCFVWLGVLDDRQPLRFRHRLWPGLGDEVVVVPGGARSELVS